MRTSQLCPDGLVRQLRRPAVVALLIVVAAAALRLVFFAGIVFYDDYHYAERALALSQGYLNLPRSIFDTRIGLVGPAALLYRAFGVSKFTTGGFPFLCSLLSVGAAFFFGNRLFGARVGLLAAVFLAVFPLDVLYAGLLFATAPVTLFVGAALGLFLLAEQQQRWTLYLASGLSLGAGALVHETSLVVLVFYPVYAIFVARPSPRHALVGAGLVVALAVDPLVHGLMGDPWARLAILTRLSARGFSTDFHGAHGRWWTETLLRMLSEQELGLFPWLAAPIVALRVVKPRDRNERALALFLAVVSLWLLFGTISPFRYAPLSRQPRYFAVLVMAAALLLAHELSERRGWRTRAAATVAIVVASIACVVTDGGRARLWPYEQVRMVLAQAGAEHVVVERRERFALLFTEGFKPRYVVTALEARVDPPAGAFLVIATEAWRRGLAVPPGAERIASVAPLHTVYMKLLRTPAAIAVLRLTRPRYRMHDLRAKTNPWALEVYRLR